MLETDLELVAQTKSIGIPIACEGGAIAKGKCPKIKDFQNFKANNDWKQSKYFQVVFFVGDWFFQNWIVKISLESCACQLVGENKDQVLLLWEELD